jgi:hypothetical protein
MFQICIDDVKLARIETQLVDYISLLKARLQWLNTSSCLVFGSITHSHVVVIIDSSISDELQLKPFIDGVETLLIEQISKIDKFNLIRCTGGLSSFSNGLCDVTPKTIKEAVEWLNSGQPTTNVPLLNNIIEAVSNGLATEGADAVYLLSQGRSALRSYPKLMELPKPIPINVSVYECNDKGSIDEYKELCLSSQGRFHLYNAKSPLYNPVVSSRPSSALSSVSSTSTSSNKPCIMLPREDVMMIWEELERARDTLADIQAIHLEKQATSSRAGQLPSHAKPIKEDYMTSSEWLKIHGMRLNNLLFADLVNKLAFQHCEGVLHNPDHAQSNGEAKMTYTTKLIDAKYCKGFVHLRCPDGRIIHTHLDERTYQIYTSKVNGVIKKCEERYKWLKKGSRELFGTILENNVVVIIDTSSSVEKRLKLIKRKLYQLLVEQLSHKTSFNLIQFNTEVICWRDHLVPVSQQNIASAKEWIDGLTASGSTNTLDALKKATSTKGVEGIYLLTDGRPDQPPDSIFSMLQQSHQVPVHSISFNCADTKANTFLSRLSELTKGRYNYYSEDISDPDGPPTYRSDDLQLLKDEISNAHENLVQAQQLRDECVKLQQTASKPQAIKKKQQRKKQSSSPLNWLTNNTLAKRHLTLIDALGPVSIPHDPAHVPLIDKHVHGKVFERILSTAHITSTGRVTLINAVGVDLVSYQAKLDSYIQECQRAMENIIKQEIPKDVIRDVRQALDIEENEDCLDEKHKEEFHSKLRDNGFDQLLSCLEDIEKEIEQANTYKIQAAELRRQSTAKRRKSQPDGLPSNDISRSNSSRSNSSEREGRIAKKDKTMPSSLNKSNVSEYGRLIKRGQHVIAQDPNDSMHYPGIVCDVPQDGYCQVLFSTGVRGRVSTKSFLPTGGSAPCPILKSGDCVLVRSRLDSLKGDMYLPAVVRAVPENPRIGNSLYSVSLLGGKIVTTNRKALVKIGRSRYQKSCDQLVSWLQSQKPSAEALKASLKLSGDSDISSLASPIMIPTSDEASPSVESLNYSEPHLSSPGSSDNNSVVPLFHEPIAVEIGHHPSMTGYKPTLCNAQTNTSPLLETKGVNTVPETRDVSTITECTDLTMEEHNINEMGRDEVNDESQLEEKDNENKVAFEANLELQEEHEKTENEDKEEEEEIEEQKINDEVVEEVNDEEKHKEKDEEEKQEENEKHLDETDDNTLGEMTVNVLEDSALKEPDNGEQVLARWMDDGWYYRSYIVNMKDETHYLIKDANNDTEVCSRSDIITDSDEGFVVFNVGDAVIALHSSYPHSYAPGHVIGFMADGMNIIIELYDGTRGILPRHEIYSTTHEKYQTATEYIKMKEKSWIGKPVIAHRQTDHLFHPGVIIEQADDKQNYLVRWSDSTTQVTNITDIFGELTRQRILSPEDYIIALPEVPEQDVSKGVCYPGRIIGVQDTNLIVQQPNGKCFLAVPEHSFWISDRYYQMITQ